MEVLFSLYLQSGAEGRAWTSTCTCHALDLRGALCFQCFWKSSWILGFLSLALFKTVKLQSIVPESLARGTQVKGGRDEIEI